MERSVRKRIGALVDILAASGIAADIAQIDDPTRSALLHDVARRIEPLLDGTTLRATLTTSLLYRPARPSRERAGPATGRNQPSVAEPRREAAGQGEGRQP